MTPEQIEFLQKQKAAKNADISNHFDLRNKIRNSEGEITAKQDYFIYVEGGERLFERPIGSGNLFYANNEEAGRVTKEEGKNVFDKKAKHKDFKTPATEQEEIQEALKASSAELEAMKKELAAIKAEKEQNEKAQKLTSDAKAKAEAGKEKEK